MAKRLTCVLMWLRRRVAARGICLSFHIGQILRTFTISPLLALLAAILDLSVTATTILPFGRVTVCYRGSMRSTYGFQ